MKHLNDNFALHVGSFTERIRWWLLEGRFELISQDGSNCHLVSCGSGAKGRDAN